MLATSLTLATAPDAGAADTLLSQNKPATASSSEGDGLAPSAAFDGNLTGTRWASEWRDPQSIQVDLAAPTVLRRLQLVWDPAYAKSYQVQVSEDGANWRAVHSTSDGNGDVDSIEIAATTARHVRLNLTARGTGWGYSLFEFGVYS
ncbi:discoidin domain-containing protein [Streptomyces sp. H27-C3]|uniref:discoidin domain-containing protein n=1 Tax=Streptomyces sp. H27-C3 TaxID=3046305 RepID=UPI0024BB6CB2|nr:discoidin domain-containing protein [Streptomyces sp. H27-C3]MDJ0460266.1 discoidin domain-containing protein [Streptomyces sp. H27-C3]